MGNTISSLTNTTTGGYLVIGLLFGGWYYWNYIRPKTAQIPQARGREVIANQPKKENNAKKQRVEQFAKSKPSSNAAAAAQAPAPAPEAKVTSSPSKSKDEIDDRAFAQRMANNKQNKFATKSSSDQKNKQKSVKQSKAKATNDAHKKVEASKVIEVNEEPKKSASSSVADADADDDQSPITTPSVSAADASGISDMLEQSSGGPSVLRLTNTEEKPKKAKKVKEPEPTETKKQRQNRQKREQEKALRAEDEKERKVLEEKQRRAAREAEGRAAKDGSAFLAAQRANAWAEKNANGVLQKDESAAHQPLDTFDNDSRSTPKAAIAPAATNGKDAKENVKTNGKKSDWAEIQLSEEEQIKLLAEEQDWAPVTKKKSKKAQKANAGVASSDDGSVNGNTAPAAAISLVPKPNAVLNNGRPKPQKIPTQSSFAALADDGDEEQEQEWDV